MVNTFHLHKWGKQGAFLCVRTSGTEWKKIGTGSTYMKLNGLTERQQAGFVAVNMLYFTQNRTSAPVLRECPIENTKYPERPAIGV